MRGDLARNVVGGQAELAARVFGAADLVHELVARPEGKQPRAWLLLHRQPLRYRAGQPANFELRLKFKLTAENDKAQANSGVQYRSKLMDPATFVVGGYQADIDNGRYIGML